MPITRTTARCESCGLETAAPRQRSGDSSDAPPRGVHGAGAEASRCSPKQASRYAAVLGPMFGGSFPASVAIYNLLKDSTDTVKFFVFGTVSIGVFAVASGLAAASLGTTNAEARYASCAALAAVTIALGLFTTGLCTLFTSLGYKATCACVFGVLIAILDVAWIGLKW